MSTLYEKWNDELAEKKALLDDTRELEAELASEVEDLEDELSQLEPEESCIDSVREADDRERAADMNATLSEIGGGL